MPKKIKPQPSFAPFSQRAPRMIDMPFGDGARGFGPSFLSGDGSRPFGPSFLDLSSLYIRPPQYEGYGLGYLPDLPDRRDRHFHQVIDGGKKLPKKAKVEQLELSEEAGKHIKLDHLRTALKLSENPEAPELASGKTPKIPAAIDLREGGCFSPVENQGDVGSCTAQAVVGLAEYLIRIGTGEFTDLARMFVYKVSRNLMGVRGDTGSYIRTAIKTLAAFGAPPETYWPYDPRLLDVEPQALQYSYAANFRAMRYARLDGYNRTGEQTLALVKTVLAAGFPVAFGFPVFESIGQVGTGDEAVIPYPKNDEKMLGGHAVLAVGYDSIDDEEVLIIRNSWSEDWGDEGYGYLPVRYVTEAMAVDFWTVFSSSWLRLGLFE